MSKKNIAVLISGSGTNLQCIIDSIKRKEIKGKIEIVISNKQDAYGLVRAEKEGIESIFINYQNFESNESYHKHIKNILIRKKIDLIVLAGYLKILPKSFIKEFENRIINIHPSLIPAFCGNKNYGMKVHQKAIEYGVKISGATTHFVNEETDGGPIIYQKSVKVDYDDTPESLQKKVLKIEHEILPKTISLYCENKIKVIGRKVKIMN